MDEKHTYHLSAKAVYKRLIGYASQYWQMFALGLLALAMVSAANTAFLALIKMVTDEGFVHQSQERLGMLPWMLFGLLTFRGLSGFFSDLSMRWVSQRVVERIRLDMFRRLMSSPVVFFDANSVGVITSKLTYNANQMAGASTKVLISVVRDSLTIVGMLGYMIYLNWRLTLIFAVISPVMVLYLRKMTPRVRASGRAVQESVGGMTRILEEAVSGQRIVKVFGGEGYENRRFAQQAGINRRMNIRVGRIAGLNSMVVEMMASAGLAWVVYYSVGKFSAGEFAAYVSAMLLLISPIKSLTKVNEDLQIGIAAAQSVFGLMDTIPEDDVGTRTLERARGEIEFRHVNLRYENAKRNALHEINVKVSPGEKVALVGRSGGGKSSLVSLLPRFYEVQQGVILLDGIDTRALTLKSLRQQFALVSQDVMLFNDTVFNNIAYGSLRDATEAEVIAAAQAAYAWEFIQQMPNGLYSEIGDRGVRLSGGQRQRIAIARAILKDAPILLLDEATSALDTESEKHVQAALDSLMQGRTSIIIAHRLSTIENADRILVMEKGEIVESGTHAELLALDKHYARLYRKQFH
jgi:ATP-binding cassette, subfamily B, bacterial MsbA